MSELKVHKIGDLCFDFKMGKDVGIDFYLKSEADKVIAELKAQVHDYAQGLYVMQARAEMELRHSNHKRCLAMAKWCESEAYIHEQGSEYDEDLVAWFGKWYKRWLELAEKFKEE